MEAIIAAVVAMGFAVFVYVLGGEPSKRPQPKPLPAPPPEPPPPPPRHPWQDLADRLGGEYQAGEYQAGSVHYPGDSPAQIAQLSFGRGKLCARYAYATDGMHRGHWCTVIEAPLVHPPVPRLFLFREGTTDRLAHRVGLHDPTIGNAEFDDWFLIEAERPALCRSVLTDDIASELLARYKDAELEIEGEWAQIAVRRYLQSAAELERAIQLMTRIAATDPLGLVPLLALPGVRPIRREHGTLPRFAVELDLVPIEIGPVDEPEARALVTEARAPLSEGARWEAVLEPEHGEVIPLDRLGARDVGATAIKRAGRELILSWPEIEHDRARVLAGARLLASCAGLTSHAGIYR